LFDFGVLRQQLAAKLGFFFRQFAFTIFLLPEQTPFHRSSGGRLEYRQQVRLAVLDWQCFAPPQ
jgi:hypothetical protein